MEDYKDIISSFISSDSNQDNLTSDELVAMTEDVYEKLRKTKKKLKRAKKKGKSGKKIKKKIKKQKRKLEELEFHLHEAKKQKLVHGRWDKLIEKSVPRLIDVAGVVLERVVSSPNKK